MKTLGNGPWNKGYEPSGININSNLPIYECGFNQGYEQAEKDLTLTWRDIMVICEHYVDVNYEYDYHSIQEKYEEILRRFKESKK